MRIIIVASVHIADYIPQDPRLHRRHYSIQRLYIVWHDNTIQLYLEDPILHSTRSHIT